MGQLAFPETNTQSMLLNGAEPFFFPGGPVGCLLVHGFTGTPKEMRWMGEYLAGQDHTVLGVRLFGHATHPEDMMRARWQDWLASVEDGYHTLSGMTKKIVVCGLSMGGVLSLVLASRYPVSGVVAMSTPEHMPADARLRFIKPLSLLKPFMAKGEPNWYDQAAYRDHVSYPADPTRAYAELRDLLQVMRASLSKVSAPTLLINSQNDQAVKPADRHQELIYQAIGSLEKQTLWVEKSSHVVTRDAEREKVFQAAGDFIARITGQPL